MRTGIIQKTVLFPALPIVLVLLTACGGSERDPEEHMLQHHQEMMERARAVEDDLLESARRQREAIDED